MNTTQMFAPLYSMLWWIIPLFLIAGAWKAFKPFIKGKVGELVVSAHVKLYLKEPYILLNDLTLPDAEGGTTQIDHIVLSPYGLFVVETKNYTGWIFGGARQKMWTQKIYKKTYKFQNPLHQNYKHMKVLEDVLEDILEPEFMHSVIVFMPESEFKTAMPENLFRGAAWTDYVKSFQQEVIPVMKLKRIQLRIEKEVLEKSWKTNRAHVDHLRQKNTGS
ncbi:nuclease-related domain-containing protein [Acinetobacter sp. ANC 3813]|uniref:nuclease-related domain-containing protein n=1 Tax=Acinetobacter sp. ANC 3813 TaxID=1977873 RepID=UPI000A33412D|nr:nuclease-related domain-containing protein [Acinetobacter sp. ANC 3813]OTG89162.1 NERD nuclease [Acinetobacter sp. ANC 3813]